MTKSPRHLWQTRWRFDRGVAIHESGLRVAAAAIVGADEVQAALTPKHGHNAAAMVERLAREGRAVLDAGSPDRARLKG